MRLYEFEGKELLARYGIPVPKGGLARSVEEAMAVAEQVGFPAVLKAQLKVGGRGKAGKVQKVEGPSQLRQAFEAVMSPWQGERPHGVLVEEFVAHELEAYAGITLDPLRKDFVLILSREGGMDVERLGPKAMRPLGELKGEEALDEALGEAGFSQEEARALLPLVRGLVALSEGIEAELAEINPIALSKRGAVALDAKIITDDNALFRHPELQKYERLDEAEATAKRYGFSLVPLDGDVVVVGNGAGLVLASLDLVAELGGRPAAFLDLGGGASAERVLQALTLANLLPGARSIFLNIFGGITRGTEVARGIAELYNRGLARRPLFARISGTEQEEARALLRGLPVKLFATPEEAARAAIEGG